MQPRKMSPSEYRIGTDLANHAVQKANQSILDAMALCSNPSQRTIIGLAVAGEALKLASADLMIQNPRLTRGEILKHALALLEAVLNGERPLANQVADVPRS